MARIRPCPWANSAAPAVPDVTPVAPGWKQPASFMSMNRCSAWRQPLLPAKVTLPAFSFAVHCLSFAYTSRRRKAADHSPRRSSPLPRRADHGRRSGGLRLPADVEELRERLRDLQPQPPEHAVVREDADAAPPAARSRTASCRTWRTTSRAAPDAPSPPTACSPSRRDGPLSPARRPRSACRSPGLVASSSGALPAASCVVSSWYSVVLFGT